MKTNSHTSFSYGCLLWFLLTLGNKNIFAQQQNIIPLPVTMKALNTRNVVVINSGTIIYYDSVFAPQATYLQRELKSQIGLTLIVKPTTKTQNKNGIYLIQSNLSRAEMYCLCANRKTVKLKAADVRGIINSIQTLLQLLPISKTDKIQVAAIHIEDYPRFAYRGMHLDVVRHFFSVSYVKKYIDYLTFHKFNTFHWHLTDDQGWRIEMKSYPRLNSIGSWRDSTLIGHFKTSPAKYDRKRYGGFYTKQEIQEILEYATVRGITVIPEIDIPGHSRAVIAAYPELSTRPDTTWNVATTWGMYNRQNNVLAPNPTTFLFLKEVFTELCTIFPAQYIHIGGDECSKTWWKTDSISQNFMRENKLKNETELQTYFIEYVAEILKKINRRPVGWHEIMEGKLDSTTLIMNWGDDKKALEAAENGFNMIMTPGKPYYFDHYQSKNSTDSLAIHGYNPLEAVYKYDPVPTDLQSKNLGHKVLGGQGNVWTEYMASPEKVDYMIFPRMTALSESLWIQQDRKNYSDFLYRLNASALPRYQWWHSSFFKLFTQWKIDN